MPRPFNNTLEKQLLQTALVFLETRGAAQFSMRELASEVGYTVTAVYRCYKNRDALLVAMQVALFQKLNQHILLTQASNELEHIEKIGEAFVLWAIKHPAYYRFMFQSSTLLNETDQKIARAGLDYLALLLNKSSDIRKQKNPKATAILLFSSLHGFVSLFLNQRLDEALVPNPHVFYKEYCVPWIQDLLTKE